MLKSIQVGELVIALCCMNIVENVFGLYSGSSDVVELTSSNFNSRVLGSDEIWIVEFYAPWCGHCKAFASEYSKAASALKGVVKVGGVDADQHQSLGGQFGVKGFPTVKIFGLNKQNPLEYNGARTAQGIVDAAFKELRQAVDGRLGGRKSSGGGTGGSKGDQKDVVELTDSNFKEMVLDSEDIWLVEFYAPWCGHCQKLEPHWAEAATTLKDKVKFGALDATSHTITSNKYGIKGFPTIKYFPAGRKDDAEDYDGGRTASDIVAWGLEKFSENAPPPEIFEINDAEKLKTVCEKNQLCIISILPHLLDCQSECRNKYIEVLKQMGEKYKRNRWGWLWAEALSQDVLEESLEIGGFGYPAMAVVNVRKMKYSLLRGSFSYDGINSFLREVAVGRGSSAPVKGATLPSIKTTTPWDGKDAEMPVEDDLDLSDVDLGDELPKHSEL